MCFWPNGVNIYKKVYDMSTFGAKTAIELIPFFIFPKNELFRCFGKNNVLFDCYINGDA